MSDLATDLPKLKRSAVATSDDKPKKAKAKTEKKVVAKTEKPSAKKVEVKKAEAKKPTAKKEKVSAKPKAEKKAKAKTEKKATVKPAKAGAITADAVISKIAKLVGGGKVEAVKNVDYASSKSVVDGLAAKAALILLKTYSDKAIASVSHSNSDIAKAAKEVLAKQAATVRNTVVTKAAKKFAGAIVKAAKAADAGKLTAADYRAVSFDAA